MNATIFCSVVTISSLLLAHRLRIMAVSGIVVTGLGFQGLRQPCPQGFCFPVGSTWLLGNVSAVLEPIW